MAWILVVIALLVLGVLVVHVKAARFAAAVAAGAIVIAGLVIWGVSAWRERIALGHLSAEDVELRVTTRDTGGRYAGRPVVNLQGRLYNRSERYRIRQFGVHMILEDCSTEAANETCVTVADEVIDVTVSIPPRQARDFVADLRYEMVMPRGELRWRVEGIPYIRAEEHGQ
ncbi:MAG TPA: hypothetical protein VKZ99_06125 [Gammaproteobacteria bacterium]|nr:hypothetical protein [Gammaproteobacteria bacterium]